MKVLHVIVGLSVGGAELMLKRLILSSKDNDDIEYTVVSLTSLGVIGKQISDRGVKVYSLNMNSFLDVFITFLRLRKLMKKLKPDIVHTWMYHADLLGGLAAWSLGAKKIIWCIRSTDISKGGSKVTIVIRKICALLSKKIPNIVVCAAEASRRVHEKVGYESDKMHVIPNGFNLDEIFSLDLSYNIRKELGVADNQILIASVGRFNPVKDHKTFISAAGKVAAKYKNVRFVLAGRYLSPKNTELKNWIDATGYPDSFFLIGEHNNVPALLKKCDLFCLHSITEGFPNVLGEAMAVGLPCISTDVGDAAYLLNNAELVVPAGSPDRLAEKMIYLITESEEKRNLIGFESSKRISENFSMDVINKRYIDLYRSLL